MAKGNPLDRQTAIMGQFSRIAKIANRPNFTQNRLVDRLIQEGAIRRSQETPRKNQVRYAGAYQALYASKSK